MRLEDVKRIRSGIWEQERQYIRYIRCLTCDPYDFTLTTQAFINASAPVTCARCMGDLWIDSKGVLVLWGHPGGGMGYV